MIRVPRRQTAKQRMPDSRPPASTGFTELVWEVNDADTKMSVCLTCGTVVFYRTEALHRRWHHKQRLRVARQATAKDGPGPTTTDQASYGDGRSPL